MRIDSHISKKDNASSPFHSSIDSTTLPGSKDRIVCETCPRHCRLAEDQTGYCRARTNIGGEIVCTSYGRLTSLALDPVEKKPLAYWRPGSFVVSVGSYGCNMSCPFCQNDSISMTDEHSVAWRHMSPTDLVGLTMEARARDSRVTGIAYTYNEPLVGWEFVRDCAILAHEHGLANVLVSNGMVEKTVWGKLAGLIDAANIDLKAADQAGYQRLGGDFETVCQTIRTLATDPACHLEITTLLVPGLVDPEQDIRSLADRIADIDSSIPWHLTRFFPRYRMGDAAPTPLSDMMNARATASEVLQNVRLGNC